MKRKPNRVIEIISFLLFAGVFLRGVLDYQKTPYPFIVALGLISFYLFRFSVKGLMMKSPSLIHAYFAGQTILVAGISLLPPGVDYFVVLYIILSIEAMIYVDRFYGAFWIGGFIVSMAFVLLMNYGVFYTLAFGMMFASSYLFFASYEVMNQKFGQESQKNKSLLNELQAAHNELKKYTVKAQRLAVAEERNRLARELHDSVTQTIFSMKLSAESARILQKKNPDKVHLQLNRIKELADSALSEMRTLIHKLRPIGLEEEGLVEILKKHFDARKELDGLSVAFTVDPKTFPEPEKKISEVLFRIVQEALNNIVKHAGTDRAWVLLKNKKGELTLTVEDKGLGFNPEILPRSDSHLGLVSMKERAEIIGASFTIESNIKSGTRICLKIKPGPAQSTSAEAI